jgi:glycosyltransferase involved in cell wall biosynthesis
MLSVIIPTHKRASILQICLQKLFDQQNVDFEVIVVEDGATDETRRAIAGFKSERCQFIQQSKSHQGVARNLGAAKAKGDLLLFIGDDIFAEPGFLARHVATHQNHPDDAVAVLGFTTWDPALKINTYMRFLESSGWQFGYDLLKPGFVECADRYKFFYTSNLSIKKAFFEKERFDEDFTGYGWEDMELGYRLLKNRDMRLFYEPTARAYHHHLLTEADLSKKMWAVGKSAVHFEKLHPEIHVIPRGWKRLIIFLATNSAMMLIGRFFGKKLHYRLRSWKIFFESVENPH